MSVTVNDLKTYLRLPPDNTDVLTLYLNAAKQEAKNAGIPDFENNAQYDMYILELAGLLYDNRSFAISGAYPDVTMNNIRAMMNANTLQLRYCEDGVTADG